MYTSVGDMSIILNQTIALRTLLTFIIACFTMVLNIHCPLEYSSSSACVVHASENSELNIIYTWLHQTSKYTSAASVYVCNIDTFLVKGLHWSSSYLVIFKLIDINQQLLEFSKETKKVLYTNIDLKLWYKYHGKMRFKIGDICVHIGHGFYTMLL